MIVSARHSSAASSVASKLSAIRSSLRQSRLSPWPPKLRWRHVFRAGGAADEGSTVGLVLREILRFAQDDKIDVACIFGMTSAANSSIDRSAVGKRMSPNW